VSETLRTLNVLPDSPIKQKAMHDQSPVEIQSAAVKTNAVVLKR
jgi:cell division protein FtsI (penicillin-binding protein 3)